ncbi:MAG: O-antigen ligase domain-containing protein [Calothrix sp. SM1_7_51]|nr:O-antigen ligase domain-containing protein [Calothrix sp. SM1_7_51]
MTYANNPANQGVTPKQSPILGWVAIIALILFTAACYFAGAGALLRTLFPVISTVVGLFLYFRLSHPIYGFAFLDMVLISLLRRLIDFRYGWEPQGIILTSSYLVSLITTISFIRYLPKSLRMGGLPFVMAIFSVIYAFMVGLINFQPLLVARTMLDWFTPLVFGFHLFVNWRDYPEYRKTIQSVFVWCVLLTGIYGIYQYIVAPEWDRFWLISTKMNTFGKPEPFGIRVWSTMHSPGPFAAVMMAGLILLFSSDSFIRIPASAAGYLAFLLSLARAAWGGWLVGLLSLLSNLKPRLQMRLMVTILVMTVCVVPLTTIEPFSDIIVKRFETFSNLEQDQSLKERSGNYEDKLNIALSTPLGNGIGGTWIIDSKGKLLPIVLDSGILDTFFALGWFGAIPYLGGAMMLLYTLFQGSEGGHDSFASASRAIALAIFFQLIFSSLMLGLAGIIFWGFLGMAMAGKKYHQFKLGNRE